MLWERDVAVVMRDGTRLYTDIFKPADATGSMPTLLAWNPYGKLSGSWSLADLPFNSGVPKSATTGWESFEAPDPGYWCAQGYAVVTPDIRGVFKSEGNYRFWGAEAALDGYDFIEWIGRQPWSNGKVGMTGNSQLAIMQWFIAATRPPCLAAIAPWEGLIDMYRNDFMNGGIADPLFNDYVLKSIYGEGMIEDISAMCERFPLFRLLAGQGCQGGSYRCTILRRFELDQPGSRARHFLVLASASGRKQMAACPQQPRVARLLQPEKC